MAVMHIALYYWELAKRHGQIDERWLEIMFTANAYFALSSTTE
jgi:hypothetical protein